MRDKAILTAKIVEKSNFCSSELMIEQGESKKKKKDKKEKEKIEEKERSQDDKASTTKLSNGKRRAENGEGEEDFSQKQSKTGTSIANLKVDTILK